MDGIRPVLRVSVVCLSLALMIGYVVVSGRRTAKPTTPAAATPASSPAPISQAELAGAPATAPSILFYGSKSAPVALPTPGATPAPGATPTALPPASQPSMLFSTSKSMILVPHDVKYDLNGPSIFQPATQPAPAQR